MPRTWNLREWEQSCSTDLIGETPHHETSVPDEARKNERSHALMQVLNAGALYFLITIGAGVVLEVIRLQVVALHISGRIAEMMEILNVLFATIIGAAWVVDRFILPPLPGIRLGVGLVALGLMLTSEWTVLQILHSLSSAGYITDQDAAFRSIPFDALSVLTVMPFLVGYRWER